MNMRSRYTRITDSELDNIVRGYTQQNRMLGCNSVVARLRSRGVVIQRHRVRSSLHRVDPSGIAIRWSRAIQRRRYSVPVTNSLWHIDGNHKLIRSVSIAKIELYAFHCDIIQCHTHLTLWSPTQ